MRGWPVSYNRATVERLVAEMPSSVRGELRKYGLTDADIVDYLLNPTTLPARSRRSFRFDRPSSSWFVRFNGEFRLIVTIYQFDRSVDA